MRIDFAGMLRVLAECHVKYVVVGGVAASLQAASLITFDLDIVHERSEENIASLLTALDRLEAHYRTRPELHMKPTESHLRSDGHQLLLTKSGALDVLGSIGNGHTYEDLMKKSVQVSIEGFTISILGLEALIAIKEETGREKDLAVLPLLRRTLEETRKKALS
jgi:hypothetical protein